MNLSDYPNGAVDAMLAHRYQGLPADVQDRPLTPTSSSEKETRARAQKLKAGASAAMLAQRYNF